MVSVFLLSLFLANLTLVATSSIQAEGRGELFFSVGVLTHGEGTVICSSPNEYMGSSGNTQTYRFKISQGSISFTAQPAEGHAFLGWYINDNYEGNFSTITLTSNNCRLTALFSPTYNTDVATIQQQSSVISSMTWAIIILAVIVAVMGVVIGITIKRNHRKASSTANKHNNAY